jgi:predicted phosphodiesterase
VPSAELAGDGRHGPRALRPIDVFAVEDDTIQVTWSGLPAREAVFEVGGRRVEVDATPPEWYRLRFQRELSDSAGGPGAITVEGLDPATDYDVCLTLPGRPKEVVATARTLPRPAGRLLSRFATVGDCHIGERRLGFLRQITDPRPRPAGLLPYPVRSARAAIAEAEAWGAGLIVAKGDLTREAEPEEAEGAAEVLATATVPVEALLGNHDVQGPADVAASLSARGIHIAVEARAVDLHGARLVIGHSPVPGLHGGRLEGGHAADLVDLAGAATWPVVVVLHHPPRRRRWNTYYPPAISRADSAGLLAGLVSANPNVVLLAGHTHRNRFYLVDGVPVAEVGSTKDYPGEWAGYTIYEGGIRQVIRRTASPDVIAWTEMTKRALGGLWGWWSPGSLADRCWTLEWSS